MTSCDLLCKSGYTLTVCAFKCSKLSEIGKPELLVIPFVELNPPAWIAILKVPDSFYTSELLTNNISDYKKEIGLYHCRASDYACSWVWKGCSETRTTSHFTRTKQEHASELHPAYCTVCNSFWKVAWADRSGRNQRIPGCLGPWSEVSLAEQFQAYGLRTALLLPAAWDE